MKILVSIILCLWLTINIGMAQSFPNIDLSGQTCAVSTNFPGIDFFANQANDGCSTAPWFVSHGTPDIFPGGFIRVGSAKPTTGSESEGVSYRQTFLQGKLYTITITFSTMVDAFKVYMANGVPIGSDKNTPSFPNRRSFKIPNVSDKELILNQGNTNNITKTITIGFSPSKNYDCLWFFAEDNNGLSADEGLNLALFKVTKLVCDAEPIKEITTTNSTFDYGPRITPIPFHISLPPKVTASNKINIIPRSFVEIYSETMVSSLLVQLDPKIALTAGNSILIKPDNAQARSAFWATYGSVFSAKISGGEWDCEDACEAFVPWDSPNFKKGLSTIKIDKCRTEPQNTEVRFVTNYPKPYNAYRVQMRVFQRGIGSGTPLEIFKQVWEDPLKRALPEGVVVWKPNLSLPDGVYPVEITLTNCSGNYIFYALDATLPNVTMACGIISLKSDDSENNGSFSATVNTFSKKQELNKAIAVVVSPNPTTGKLTIQSSSNIEKPVINITNILGISMANFTNDNMLENNTFECDISHFPTGVYIVSIVSNNKIISRTKISKL